MSENNYLGKNLVILNRENFRILQDQKEIMSFAENRDLYPNVFLPLQLKHAFLNLFLYFVQSVT